MTDFISISVIFHRIVSLLQAESPHFVIIVLHLILLRFSFRLLPLSGMANACWEKPDGNGIQPKSAISLLRTNGFNQLRTG